MDIQNVVKMYFDQKLSIVKIAEHYNTYPNKIRRLLKNNGYSLRSHSESQKLALDNGSSHPTKGKQRSHEERMAISSGVYDAYKNWSEEDKQKKAQAAKERWENQSEEYKREFAKLSHESLKKAAEEGSKLERFIKEQLDKQGFHAYKHIKGLVPNLQLEPDLYVERLRTIIEVDGLSHFQPIWGEETLRKVQESDTEKNALFLANGYCVIRIRNTFNSYTLYRYQQSAELLIALLEEIEKQFPPPNKRYFEIGVKE